MDGVISPYDVFRVDKPDSNVTDPEFGAYQLPNGEVRVLTNNFGQSQISFNSREEADVFLIGIKDQAAGQLVELNPQDYPKILTSSVSFEDRSVQSVPPHEARAITKDSDNNRPENLQSNPTDSPSPKNIDRTGAEEPETEYAGGTFLEDVEHWIPSLFEPAHKGMSGLKDELANDVDENNWFAKAVGTSALDVMGAAMSFTEGIPLGLLDTRRIGEGLAEGTWEGAKKDVSRALNVLPQGRLLKAVDRALTVSNVVESVNAGDLKGAGLALGMGVLAVASKTRAKSKSTNIGQVLTKEQIEVANHLQKRIFSPERHSGIGGMVAQMEGIASRQKAAAVSIALHLRARRELQLKFGSKVKVSAGPGDIGVPVGKARKGGKLSRKQTMDLEVQTNQGIMVDTMKIELKATAWIDHKGKIGMPAMFIPGAKKSKVQQLNAIEGSADRNRHEPHLIITPKDIFHFDPDSKQWSTLN